MSIVDTAKDVYEVVKKSATLEVQEKLMRLREEALELQEENLALRSQVKELQDALETDQNLIWDGTVYWLELTDGDRDGPFCQKCYDSGKTLIRLQNWETVFACFSCESRYNR